MSIEFDPSPQRKLCLEPLQLQENYQASFITDYRKPNKKKQKIHFIGFFNVPSEIEDQLLTDFVEQYANMEGPSKRNRKIHYGLEYKTGTRVYTVRNILTHTPGFN